MSWEAEFERRNHRTTLLTAFALHPAATGAVAPTCRRLVDHLTEGLERQAAGLVVELGAGSGSVTRAIDGKVGSQATVVAVELNAVLWRRLVALFPDCLVLNASAEHLPELLRDLDLPQADVILSELPWTSFDRAMRARIVDAVSRSLREGGRFATTVYWPAARFPAGRHFRRLLEGAFSEVRKSPIVWTNIPPGFVYECRK
jgi:phosphatidylethanolamine/phosphatidyl-N-methylethanolamine N-methyltransferase